MGRPEKGELGSCHKNLVHVADDHSAVSEIAGFLHLIKLHWITAEALRTIARHQRQYKPITAAELQKRLLKYEEDLKQWYLGIPREYSSHHANLPEELLPERFISELAFFIQN